MKNLFIFVADSLRWDYLPGSIEEEGTALRTLAPSLHTPVSFSSLVTAKSPERHNVRGFDDRLKPYKTVFDRFEHGTFYDNENDPMRKRVLADTPEKKELEELEEPFVCVERAMESHDPYAEMGHGNELEKIYDNYFDTLGSVEQVKDAYGKGVEAVEQHFWNHVEKLEELGLREDTLIVFTSDHGEFLGERVNGIQRFSHNHPMARELVEVPTVFLEEDLDADSMRLIDIVETSLGILDKKGLDQQGVDVRNERAERGRVLFDGYTTFDEEWVLQGEKWLPKRNLTRSILREDLRIFTKDYLDRELIPKPDTTSNIDPVEMDIDF